MRQVSGVELKSGKAVRKLGVRVIALDRQRLGQVVQLVDEGRSLHLLFGREGTSQIVLIVVDKLNVWLGDEVRDVILGLNYLLQVVVKEQK